MNFKKNIYLMNFFTDIIPLLIIAVISFFVFSKKIKELEEEFHYLGINHPVVSLSKKIESNRIGVLSGVLDLSLLAGHLSEYKIGKNGRNRVQSQKLIF